MSTNNLYSDILVKGIFGEIIKVRNAEALSATIIMVYVAIDTMAFLSMPQTNKKNGSIEFIDWVNKYLKLIRRNHTNTMEKKCGALVAQSCIAILLSLNMQIKIIVKFMGILAEWIIFIILTKVSDWLLLAFID